MWNLIRLQLMKCTIRVKLMSLEHLDWLKLRLSHERERLANARTDQEKATWTIWVRQLEKEIAGELKFLGINEKPLPEMTDDELMAELDKG